MLFALRIHMDKLFDIQFSDFRRSDGPGKMGFISGLHRVVVDGSGENAMDQAH